MSSCVCSFPVRLCSCAGERIASCSVFAHDAQVLDRELRPVLDLEEDEDLLRVHDLEVADREAPVEVRRDLRRVELPEGEPDVADRGLAHPIGALDGHDPLRRENVDGLAVPPEAEGGAVIDLRRGRRAQEVAAGEHGEVQLGIRLLHPLGHLGPVDLRIGRLRRVERIHLRVERVEMRAARGDPVDHARPRPVGARASGRRTTTGDIGSPVTGEPERARASRASRRASPTASPGRRPRPAPGRRKRPLPPRFPRERAAPQQGPPRPCMPDKTTADRRRPQTTWRHRSVAVERVGFCRRARFPLLGPFGLHVDDYAAGDGKLEVRLLGLPLQRQHGTETGRARGRCCAGWFRRSSS